MVYPIGPLKRENRLSAVPTDQAGRTVARPHHSNYFKGEPGVRQSGATNLPNQTLALWTHSLGSWHLIAIIGHHDDIKTTKEALQQIE